MRTDKELKEIAMGIRAGTIFTDRNIRKQDHYMIGSIFMPIALMDDEDRKEYIASKPGMIFEHISKAAPRAVNGYPIFFTMQTLSYDEADKVCEYFQKIEEVVEKL
jgi:hypothetical protein